MSLTVCNVHLTPKSEKNSVSLQHLNEAIELTGKNQYGFDWARRQSPLTLKPVKRQATMSSYRRLRSFVRVPKSGMVYLRNDQEGDLQLGR